MRSQVHLIPLLASLLEGSVASAANSSWPWQTYKSSTAQPPSLQINKTSEASPGYLFFDQDGDGAHQYSVFIMSDDNELIWQGYYGDLTAFRVHTFEGKPVLTFFNGLTLSEPWGWGHGIIQILNDSYTSIYNLSITAAQENLVTTSELDPDQLWSYIDLHEANITPEGTILVTLYNTTKYDLSSVGGPEDGWVTDSLFYEMDIKTNEILFRWSALAHKDQIPIENVLEFYPIADYGQNQSIPYGYFHINSVDKFADGSYLVSSRYFSSIFKIATNGSVEWTLQGKDGGDFTLDPKLSFSYQHDARIRKEVGNKVQISLFDNSNSDVVSGIEQTSGIFLTIDTEAMTATLDKEYIDPQDPTYSVSQGNTQLLDNGHVVMGYGSVPTAREYTANGATAMTAKFGPADGSVFSYRIYRLPWVGRPNTRPDAFACADQASNSTLVYMSWNGATEHRLWKVFAAASNQTELALAAEVKKTGFETVAAITGRAAYVRVEAEGIDITPGVSEVISAQGRC
ncbi:Arylsulfotransferase-domain-containing protein [Biscogniauxia mediterranea]|nr:Arylsulfotransferase-domain-containing protein [Biscogniauxia mediterranea]